MAQNCKHEEVSIIGECVEPNPLFGGLLKRYLTVRCSCGNRLLRAKKITYLRCNKCGATGKITDWEYGLCDKCKWAGPVISGFVGP